MPILFLAFLINWNKNLIFQTGLLVFMALWFDKSRQIEITFNTHQFVMQL